MSASIRRIIASRRSSARSTFASPMTISNCTLDDFAQVFTDIDDFWGHDRTRYRQHSLGVSAARRRRRPGLPKERSTPPPGCSRPMQDGGPAEWKAGLVVHL